MQKKKFKNKISFFLPSFRTGGSEKVCIELANYLYKNFKYNIEIICVNNEGKLKNVLDKNIRIINLNKNSVSESMLPLIRHLRNNNAKLIISSMSHCNIILIISKLLSGSQTKIIVRECSSIYTLKSPFSHTIKNIILKLLIRIFYKNADYVISNSIDLAKHLKKEFNLKKVKVIYNGYDLKKIKELSLEKPFQNFFYNKKVIIAVGRLSHEKGLDILIKAFELVRKELNCKLLILGEGPQKTALLKLSKELSLEKDIHFLGYQKNPYAYIKRSDLFVLPSLIEGLPGALIQALILNKKMISTNCNFGPREILKNGKLGKLIPINDKKKLALQIINELNNPSPIRNEIDLDLYRFNMKNIVKEYNFLFKKVIESDYLDEKKK